MAWIDMAVAPLGKVGESNEESWEFSEVVVSATGNSIIIPPGCNAAGVTVKRTSGTYVVQATTDKIYTIKNDAASVTWIDWDYGSMAVNAQDEFSTSASAVRIITTGGTSEIKVSAK